MMGAAHDGGLVLPPPCREREHTLRAVLPRSVRLATARNALGEVVVAEGARPRHRPTAPWRHDAAGVMTLGQGTASVRPVPWPQLGVPRFARVGSRWLTVIDDDASLELWRDGRRERLGDSPPLRAADLACRGTRCALLTTSVASNGEPQHGATLWIGVPDEVAQSWLRVVLPPTADRPSQPLSIARMAPAGDGVDMTVATVDDLRVRFVEVVDGRARSEAAALSAPHGALDAIAAPRPAALTFATTPGANACSDPDGGGTGLVVHNAAPRRLRSPTPATQGRLHPIAGGMLATWLAPERCGAPRQQLHAVMLDTAGTPVAPVTTVGPADGYAVASADDRVDLWVHATNDGATTTVGWIRARCRLPH